MFRKFLASVVIPLVFVALMTRSSESVSFRHGLLGVNSCDDEDYYGYCIDCETSAECSNGNLIANDTCTADQACEVSTFYSTCADNSKVPDCQCPETGTVQLPDPYDPHKYLVCSNGVRHIFDCGDAIFDEESQTCQTVTTTTPVPVDCPTSTNTKANYNCTCYLFCFNNGQYSPDCCPGGQIFDEETLSCVDYEIFTCEGKVDGRYDDPHNCSIYYTCQSGVIFEKRYCGDVFYYNTTTNQCENKTDTSCEKEIPDCGICQDAETHIKIDCFNYYACIESTEDWGQPYVPVAKECPNGTCFDESTGLCEAA